MQENIISLIESSYNWAPANTIQPEEFAQLMDFHQFTYEIQESTANNNSEPSDILHSHEFMHNTRMAYVGSDYHIVPHMDVNHTTLAMNMMKYEIVSIMTNGISFFTLNHLIPIVLPAVAKSLVNIPADIRIAEIMAMNSSRLGHQHYDFMRESLSKMHRFSRTIDNLLPVTLVNSIAAMQCVLEQSIPTISSKEYDFESLSLTRRQYRLAMAMKDVISSTPQKGYDGDYHIANEWAKILGIASWYTWRRVDMTIYSTRKSQPLK